jgi:ectoine hydroxylase-related dioxygenase (phytanoyl-CoA dioxygenase family)
VEQAPKPMPAQLSEEQLRLFGEDGALHIAGAFKDWVDPLRAGVEENLHRPGPHATDSIRSEGTGRFLDDYCNWERIQPYSDFARSSGCAQLAGMAMGTGTARLFHEHLLLKAAGTSKATPWHHDLPYYCVEGSQFLSVWIPLDPVPSEQALRFIAGSHRWGALYYPRKFADGRNYDYKGSGYATVPNLDDAEGQRILSWPCQPGDAVLFDFRTLHGTLSHRLSEDRRAIAFRWLGEDVRFCRRPGETSPPYPGLDLETGDALPEERFPVLWP